MGIINLGSTYIGSNTYVNVIGSTATVLGVVNPLTLVDGSVLLSNTPPLDISNNYGTVWTSTATSLAKWYGVAMSASGQYQTAATGTGGYHLYFHQLRCDVDTTKRHIYKLCTAVAMSASGQYQTAGYIAMRVDSLIFPAITVSRGQPPQYL
jgi:hypothetical protein